MSIRITEPNANKIFQLDFDQQFQFSDEEDFIDGYVNQTVESFINPINSNELIRFKPESEFVITPTFSDSNTTSANYNLIGFTNEELFKFSSTFVNSLYIFEYFTDFNENLKSKISNNSVKADDSNASLIITNRTSQSFLKLLDVSSVTPRLLFQTGFNRSEFNNIYIPENLIEASLTQIFMRISFFNAKTGKRRYFIINSNKTGEERFFIRILLNLDTKEFRLANPVSTIVANNIDIADVEGGDEGSPNARSIQSRGLVTTDGKIIQL